MSAAWNAVPIESPRAPGTPLRESANATAAAPTPTFPGVRANVPATSTAASVVTATARGCACPNATAIDPAATTRDAVASAIQSPTRRQLRRRRDDTARATKTIARAATVGNGSVNRPGPRPTKTTAPTQTSRAAPIVTTVPATPVAPAAFP